MHICDLSFIVMPSHFRVFIHLCYPVLFHNNATNDVPEVTTLTKTYPQFERAILSQEEK
jgi:hypothetical protein